MSKLERKPMEPPKGPDGKPLTPPDGKRPPEPPKGPDGKPLPPPEPTKGPDGKPLPPDTDNLPKELFGDPVKT